MQPISKSDFLNFQVCPRDTWLRRNRPDFAEKFARTDFDLRLMEQGNEVEEFVRKLFPNGFLISSTGDEAIAETTALIRKRGSPIFQAAFLVDGLFAKCDVLLPSADDELWDLYEIKGTNARKENSEDRDHISDLAFQRQVLTLAGLKIGKAIIVHLNKDYVRAGAIDVSSLFTISDSTELVDKKSPEIIDAISEALAFLGKTEEPQDGCKCHLNGRSRHCRTFEYSHPHVPKYSVHDLVRIGNSKKKLADLVGKGIFDVSKIPDDFKLSEAQLIQVRAHKNNKPIINKTAITEELGKYELPLYFLDYETYAPAIPAFDGFSPYRRIPFQFSMHVLKEDGADPAHVEFLHSDRSDPTAALADLLEKHVGETGSIVVWHAGFESAVNKEIGARLGGAKEKFMQSINERMVDLEVIFTKLHYVDSQFRGRTSIKKVLPVLVPELSYDNLEIQDGTMASERWWAMTAAGTLDTERAQIGESLRKYCGQDSYAMFAIWKTLRSLA